MNENDDKYLKEITATIQNTSGVVVEPVIAIAVIKDKEKDADAKDSDEEDCKIILRFLTTSIYLLL